MTAGFMDEQITCSHCAAQMPRRELIADHECEALKASRARGGALIETLGGIVAEDDESDEHFPWHYTEFGVVCACGAPMDSAENCLRDAVRS